MRAVVPGALEVQSGSVALPSRELTLICVGSTCRGWP